MPKKTSQQSVAPFFDAQLTDFLTNTLVLWLVNALVILVGYLLFSPVIELGTARLTVALSTLLSSMVLTMFVVAPMEPMKAYGRARGEALTNSEWMVYYFFINFVAVWIIGRLATYLGLGVESWIIVAALALVLDFVQGFSLMFVNDRRS